MAKKSDRPLQPNTSRLIRGLLATCFCGLLASVCAAEEPISATDRDHWAYRPLRRPQLPASSANRGENPIDRFVQAALRKRSLRPAPPATRRQLIRRLSLNLLGLPPTPADVERFVADRSPTAYQRLVDRFLASPAFGERWGQHWLDLARYADTEGFEFDKLRPRAWRYRDWVIQALNRDMPYDQFVRLQLAGDEQQPSVRVATGFCVSGPDMPDINSQEERRHHVLNELTSTVAAAFLGLQFGCAQCHDHKYDPISQADFYRLRAFFETSVQVKRYQTLALLRESPNYRPQSYIRVRGDWRRRGQSVRPMFPRILAPQAKPIVDQRGPTMRRTRLANWLTSKQNPLTARVIVNRIWQHHFGRGLFATASDVGQMGAAPSHPQLLDWLASELVASQWRLKRLHRLIVCSATYRQASVLAGDDRGKSGVGDESKWLARFPLRRLEGEVVRDAMLAVSDSLNRRRGGRGVMAPLPKEMLATLLRNQWKTTKDVTQHQRRSIYLFARRNLRYPLFEAFDRPDANASCPRRRKTTTATQSLLLLNSEFSLQCAKRLAKRIEDTNVAGRQVEQVYLRLFARPPSAAERKLAREFLATQPKSIGLRNFCLALFNTNEFIYVD